MAGRGARGTLLKVALPATKTHPACVDSLLIAAILPLFGHDS
jgi:hypothetical protein